MSVLTEPTEARITYTPTSSARLTFVGVLRSELIKLLSIRSTWWSIAVVLVISIGMSVLIAFMLASIPELSDGGFTTGVTLAVLAPTQFTMLLAGAIGAIAVTSEYASGMIRTTLSAVPRRGMVLAAKALTVFGVIVAVSAVSFAASILAIAFVPNAGSIDWANAETSTIPLLTGVLSLACFALLGLAFGFILRNGAGAIAATVGLLFVLPIVFGSFPPLEQWEWLHNIANYLPMNAAQSLMIPGGGLEAVPALVTLVAWVAAGLAGAWLTLRTRDA